MFREGGIYKGGVHPDDLEVLGRMTDSKNWDSANFSEVLVALAKLGNKIGIPARNRPESIHLQSLRPLLDDLRKRTKDTGREHARSLFADIKRSKLVGGRVTIGSKNQVFIDATPKPGEEQVQRFIGSIHTHPSIEGGREYGFSGQDFEGFLASPGEQAMIIAYGEAYVLLVMKTSVTPNNLDPNIIHQRVEEAVKEFNPAASMSNLVNFNKDICTEFGIVMYMATPKTRDLFERIPVVANSRSN